ncbi:unnamed protein product [Arabidopsis halleri]
MSFSELMKLRYWFLQNHFICLMHISCLFDNPFL